MSKQKKRTLALVLAAVVLVAAFLAVYFITREQPVAGDKTITVEIIYDDVDRSVTIQTDQEYLRGALEQEGLIEGQESEYGIYITAVDGRVADEGAQEWWCITKGGEQVNTGADTTVIEDGDKFELTLMAGW